MTTSSKSLIASVCFPKAISIDEVLDISDKSTSTGDNSFALFMYSKASLNFSIQQTSYNFQVFPHIYLDVLKYILIENKPTYHYHQVLLLF